ncbi:hypothetical protein N7471_013788 [Penicillium samsonianum]|uniref:uncharacterized protein n=1 Tax=Penicillium samsonianum TaxID=1882272 RepID=UPI0025477EC0|nr:uncharacterized protein N7471_013788 [Penicillium samsonianum]KAJ6118321.1 hypothetical protein N7471_013788 [Penicillium samsonianum]
MSLVLGAWSFTDGLGPTESLIQMDTVEAFYYLSFNLPALISRMTDLAAHTSAYYTEYSEAFHRQKSLRLRYPTNHSVRPVQPNEVVWIDQRRNTSKFDKSIAKAKGLMDSTQCSGRKRRAEEDLPIGRNEPFAPVNNDTRSSSSMTAIHKRCLKSSSGVLAFSGVIYDERKCRWHRRAFFQRQWTKHSSVIDLANKQLELAHELCETAAYQALRTGDCASEIDSALKISKSF